MESEQRCGLDKRAKLRNALGTHEWCGQPENEPIERAEIGRALSGAIADEQLMLEKQGLCSDGACATGSKEFCESDNQVNGKDE